MVAVVEVPADDRVLRRGLVAGGEGYLADQAREGGQNGPLRHLGDRDDPCVSLFPAYADGRDDDCGGTDEEQLGDPDQVLWAA